MAENETGTPSDVQPLAPGRCLPGGREVRYDAPRLAKRLDQTIHPRAWKKRPVRTPPNRWRNARAFGRVDEMADQCEVTNRPARDAQTSVKQHQRH